VKYRVGADEDGAGFLAGCVLMLVVYGVITGALYLLWWFRWITWG
jgi:hypothetical protein